LIEATAFGALTIIERFEGYGVHIKEVVNCGGIAEKNPLLLQIYADVTGKVIVRRFDELDPMQIPAVLVANHGPFTWGKTPAEAVENAVVLDQLVAMAAGTIMLNPQQAAISRALLDGHYLRKHGKEAYYGQK